LRLAKSATKKPAILARLGEFAQRFLLGLRQAGVSVVAAFFAYIPTHLIGLQQSFWSAITAIAVAQMEFKATRALARKQFTGAAIGGAVGLGMILWFGDSLWVYASAIMLAVLICWLLNVGDAGQLGGITATIIMLVPHTGTPQSILISRLSEVGWGVCAGLGVAWATDLLVRRYGRNAPL
jgi:uncharacterized membrane protein YgaE (UPF0421/DUF939 family)